MDIRLMTIEDYDAVYVLWKRTPGMGFGKADEREGIDRFIKRNPTSNFVALDGGKIIGAILGGHDGRKGYIFHAAVDEEYQGRGIGKKLVDSVKEALLAEGIERFCLLVFKKNEKGNEFWSSTGWQKRNDLNYYTFDNSST